MTSTISRPAVVPPEPIVLAPVGSNSRAATSVAEPIALPLREPNSRPAIGEAPSTAVSPDGAQLAARQAAPDSHGIRAGSDQQGRDRDATDSAASMEQPLLDPALSLAADTLDDIEKMRMAAENRLRAILGGTKEEEVLARQHYANLATDHPVVAAHAEMVDSLREIEKKATLTVERMMRKHPLGPWVKAQRGIGDKQAGRLLAAIGDPYLRHEITKADGTVVPAGPRTVSALWAYCGLHVLPAADQGRPDAHHLRVGGGDSSTGGDSSHAGGGNHQSAAGVAARRRKGQQANWSEKARMRAWNVAKSCMKQLVKPCAGVTADSLAVHVEDCRCGKYRLVYDTGRAKYAAAVHDEPCVRCGPKGKPAPAGSPLSGGHKEARALRLVMKEIVKDLWHAGRDWHLAQKESPVVPS